MEPWQASQGVAIALVVVGLGGLIGIGAGAVGLFVLRVEHNVQVERMSRLEDRIHDLEKARS